MKRVLGSGSCAALVLAGGMVAFAQQTPEQRPAQPEREPAAQSTAQQAGEETTLVGCVQREADYRRARGAGRGGAVGTGVGADNEFVLVNASISTAATTGAAGNPPEAVGTSGAAGDAYELTGPGEGQLDQYVGKRVEIVGKRKTPSSGDSTRVTGGGAGAAGTTGTTSTPGREPGTAGAPPAGQTDPLGQDLNLREFEVSSVREAQGSCAPMGK